MVKMPSKLERWERSPKNWPSLLPENLIKLNLCVLLYISMYLSFFVKRAI